MARAQRVVRRHREPDRRVGARDLLERDDVVVELHPGAAIGLGDLHAEEAHLAEGGDDLVREALFGVPAPRVRDDDPLAQLAHGPLQHDLLLGEREVHGVTLGATGGGVGVDVAGGSLNLCSGPAGA